MLKKYNTIFICLLCFLAIFSTGFASWTIVHEFQPIDVKGNIVVDDVVRFGDYVTTKSISSLKYTKDGFIGSDKTLGNIQISLDLNLTKCREVFGSDATIQIEFTLGYQDVTPQEYDVLSCIQSAIASTSDSVLVSKTNTNILPIYIDLDAYASVSVLPIDITYQFHITDEKYFTESSSPLVQNSATIFNLGATLSVLSN